jgi:hypothetical protein
MLQAVLPRQITEAVQVSSVRQLTLQALPAGQRMG